MSKVDYTNKEINCKIVYYGPGMSGKTTNLKHVFGRVPERLRGEMISLATEDERTLFFDFLPVELGKVQGYTARFHLYTVPGQQFYNHSRRLLLRGVDGIVFVADASFDRIRATAESMRNLRENMIEEGIDINDVPIVIQVNKTDQPNALPADKVWDMIDPKHQYTMIPAVASEGVGVFDTFKEISKLVLERFGTD